MLETRIKKGGKLRETVSVNETGDGLTIVVEIDRRDWKWIAKIYRVFTRVPVN